MRCNDGWGSGYGCSCKSFGAVYRGPVAEGVTEADKQKQWILKTQNMPGTPFNSLQLAMLTQRKTTFASDTKLGLNFVKGREVLKRDIDK